MVDQQQGKRFVSNQDSQDIGFASHAKSEAGIDSSNILDEANAGGDKCAILPGSTEDADIGNRIKEIKPGKLKCVFCIKCFKDTKYVWKHMRKEHAELLKPKAPPQELQVDTPCLKSDVRIDVESLHPQDANGNQNGHAEEQMEGKQKSAAEAVQSMDQGNQQGRDKDKPADEGMHPMDQGNRESSRKSSPSNSKRPSRQGRSRSKSTHGTRSAEKSYNEESRRCWKGWDCVRTDCPFSHPGGRRIDERPAGTLRKEGRRNERQRSERRLRHSSRTPPRRRKRSETPRRRKRSETPRRRRRNRGDSETSCRRRSKAPRRKRQRCRSSSSKSDVRRKQDTEVPSRETSVAEPNQQIAKVVTQETSDVHAIVNPIALSFRQFVIQEIGDDLPPQEIVDKYYEFEQSMIKQRLKNIKEFLKDSSLLFDMYHPKALIEQHASRKRRIHRCAQRFVTDMQNQQYAGLHLVGTYTTQSVDKQTICLTAGHLQAPHFAFDPNKNSLLLSDIPHNISLAEILQKLEEQTGFSTISAPRLQDDCIKRELQVQFETEESCRSALEILGGICLKGEYTLRGSLLLPSSSVPSRVAPPAFSTVERIEKDLDMSARVLRKLDALWKVPEELSNALLTCDAAAERKLDLQILYLRRVHHFCFYSCQWCSDEWDLYRKCGYSFLRSHPVVEGDDKDVVGAHDHRLESFISEACVQKPGLPSLDELPFSFHLQEELAAHIHEFAPSKFKCMICSKAFKGEEFTRKHLQKNHPELCERALEKACNDVVDKGYIADPMRPGWRSRAQAPSVLA